MMILSGARFLSCIFFRLGGGAFKNFPENKTRYTGGHQNVSA